MVALMLTISGIFNPAQCASLRSVVPGGILSHHALVAHCAHTYLGGGGIYR